MNQEMKSHRNQGNLEPSATSPTEEYKKDKDHVIIDATAKNMFDPSSNNTGQTLTQQQDPAVKPPDKSI